MATDASDLPDPFVLDAQGKYYLYTSTTFGSDLKIPLIVGSPGHWSKPKKRSDRCHRGRPRQRRVGWSGHRRFTSSGGLCHVLLADTVLGALPVQHCIAVATSKSP